MTRRAIPVRTLGVCQPDRNPAVRTPVDLAFQQLRSRWPAVRRVRLLAFLIGVSWITGTHGSGTTLCAQSPDNGPPAASTPIEPPATDGTAAQVLQLFGIDESLIRFLRDNEPVADGEWEPIQRLVYVLPRIDVASRSAWSRPLPPVDDLLTQPDRYRLKLFRLSGHVTRISRRTLSPEAARRFAFASFYLLHFAADNERPAMTVATRVVPQAWLRCLQVQGGEAANFEGLPASCDGLFLKIGTTPSAERDEIGGIDGSQSTLVFAGARVAWHPNQPNVELNVSRGAAQLGAAGMDIGLFDDVQHRSSLGNSDREGFYQLLWAVERLRKQEDQSVELDVVSVLKTPAEQVGKRFRVHGLARRAIKIRVPDADIRDRYGVHEYYEVDLFMPLAKSIRLIDEHDASERTYHRFPLTVCCRSLPNSFPLGDEIRQPVVVDGYFFKLRSYRSNRVINEHAAYELSPLLVASKIEIDESGTTESSLPAWILAATVIGGAGLALAVQRWYAKSDRRFRTWKNRSSSPPSFNFDDRDR